MGLKLPVVLQAVLKSTLKPGLVLVTHYTLGDNSRPTIHISIDVLQKNEATHPTIQSAVLVWEQGPGMHVIPHSHSSGRNSADSLWLSPRLMADCNQPPEKNVGTCWNCYYQLKNQGPCPLIYGQFRYLKQQAFQLVAQHTNGMVS